jgi:hypothetical protein
MKLFSGFQQLEEDQRLVRDEQQRRRPLVRRQKLETRSRLGPIRPPSQKFGKCFFKRIQQS